jgi:deferrochelatase/peroxidase EfeB
MSPLDRREFLTGSMALIGAGAVGAAGGALAQGATRPAAEEQSAAEIAERSLASELATRVAFDGPHQAGILNRAPAQATFVALDSIAPNRSTLVAALEDLSTRARELTQGSTVGSEELDDPPPDCGILGPINAPDELTVTIAFGASLFDGRYGLAALKPSELEKMPNFPTDDLDPTRSDGDVLLSICAAQRDTVAHTLRELMRAVVGHMVARWSLDGFQSAKRGPTPRSNPRNLFAFRDGTANPDTGDASLMDELIWIPPARLGSNEPAWTAGGTYQVTRAIRMHVEFWDRVGMFEQQHMIGRDRASGAPLGGSEEFEDPRYDLDPEGTRIPLNAHIRLANPRTPQTANQRILRRGYNYDRGIDEAGNLDQGLAFVAFNQSIRRQFATIQGRLNEEVRDDPGPPQRRGNDRLHNPRRRRLLLRPARRPRSRRLGRLDAFRLTSF